MKGICCRRGHRPVNRVDRAAFEHDLGYRDAETTAELRSLDEQMVDDMEVIIESGPTRNWREHLEAHVVWLLMALKCALKS